MTSYFMDRFGVTVEEAGMKELKDFFDEFRWHFNDNDIEEFLADAAEVGVKEVPGMVQDSLECSFR